MLDAMPASEAQKRDVKFFPLGTRIARLRRTGRYD
jgi:hypothetical protein